jgi:pyruvate dehydrogenase E2 component (dihydrolipoamide acetyltransferase)
LKEKIWKKGWNKSMVKENVTRLDLHRRAIATRTSSSWQNIPHVSYIYEPDITDFYQEFGALARERQPSDRKITFNTIMLKVIVEGLLVAPSLNSFLEYNIKKSEGTIEIVDEINVSVPWLLPDGKMITPTIFDVGKMSLQEIAGAISEISRKLEKTDINELMYRAAFSDTIHELKSLNLGVLRRVLASKVTRYRVKGLRGKEKARYNQIPVDDRLTEDDILSGTVTVSNVGSMYKEQRGSFALLEIIPPQVLAVGIGSVQEKPGVFVQENGEKAIGIRKILPMCLAFDHRAVDFSALIPFIKRLDEIFANPRVIQNW